MWCTYMHVPACGAVDTGVGQALVHVHVATTAGGDVALAIVGCDVGVRAVAVGVAGRTAAAEGCTARKRKRDHNVTLH